MISHLLYNVDARQLIRSSGCKYKTAQNCLARKNYTVAYLKNNNREMDYFKKKPFINVWQSFFFQNLDQFS